MVGAIGVERVCGGGSAAEVSSPGFGVVRRRRSEAWERGESKRAHEIDFWGMCSARALARRGRRLLQRACHRDGEVAAARTLLGSAARVARPGGLQREATGGGGGAARCVGASVKQEVAGWPSTAGGGTAQRRRQGKQESRLEEGENRLICNFQKF